MSTPIGERQAGPRQGKEKLLGTERMGPLLAPWLGLKGLWIAFPIADTLAAAITMGWLVLFLRRKLDGNAFHPATAE